MLEGEVSHVEIPRTSSALGMTIVGGADTPLVRESHVLVENNKPRFESQKSTNKYLKDKSHSEAEISGYLGAGIEGVQKTFWRQYCLL